MKAENFIKTGKVNLGEMDPEGTAPVSFELYAGLAESALGLGHYEIAKDYSAQALDLDVAFGLGFRGTKASSILKIIGQHYFRNQDYKKAEECFLILEKCSTIYRSFLVSCLQAQGKYEEAKIWCYKMLEESPGDTAAHEGLARCFLAQKDGLQSQEHFLQALKEHFDYGSYYAFYENGVLLDLFQGLYKHFEAQNDYTQLKELCSRTLDISATEELVYERLDTIRHYFIDRQDHEQAQECLAQLQEISREGWGGYIELGQTALIRKNYEQAEEYFLKALEIYPDDLEACIGLGDCFKACWEYEQAQIYYFRALAIDPGDCRIYVRIGDYFYENKDHEQAERYYREALKLDPDNSLAYTGLGHCALARKKHEQAQEFYSKALDINYQEAEAHVGLAAYFYAEENYAESMEHYSEVLSADRRNDRAWLGLGNCFFIEGYYWQAKEHYSKAVKLNPDNDKAQAGIFHCEYRLEQMVQATEAEVLSHSQEVYSPLPPVILPPVM